MVDHTVDLCNFKKYSCYILPSIHGLLDTLYSCLARVSVHLFYLKPLWMSVNIMCLIQKVLTFFKSIFPNFLNKNDKIDIGL